MAIEMDAERAICCRCGTAYGRKKGNFPVSYAGLYRGAGYLPFCKNCVDAMYNDYVTKCEDPKKAVRQMCRKLDIYWHELLYERVAKKATTRTMMTNYIQASNNLAYAGKSYDDTLIAEGRLWNFSTATEPEEDTEQESYVSDDTVEETVVTIEDIPEDVIAYWGPGYTPEMYLELEQRLQYYKGQMREDDQLDMSTQALLRQIAMMEIDINKARADGKSVDKMVTALNALLSSLKRPSKKETAEISGANTPFGVLTKIVEDRRPIPEWPEENYLIKYITVWFFGHLCKMLGIKNSYCSMYEKEIEKLRVSRPEYDDEDDDTLLNDLFGGVELDIRGTADYSEIDSFLSSGDEDDA